MEPRTLISVVSKNNGRDQVQKTLLNFPINGTIRFRMDTTDRKELLREIDSALTNPAPGTLRLLHFSMTNSLLGECAILPQNQCRTLIVSPINIGSRNRTVVIIRRNHIPAAKQRKCKK